MSPLTSVQYNRQAWERLSERYGLQSFDMQGVLCARMVGRARVERCSEAVWRC